MASRPTVERRCKYGHVRLARGRCKECLRLRRKRDRVKRSESAHDRYREYQRQYVSRRKAREPEWRINSRRRHNGLPAPTRTSAGACECCGRLRKVSDRRLALDHNHATGEFRGWLCTRCNAGIGLLGDSFSGVLQAVAYLQANDSSSWLD